MPPFFKQKYTFKVQEMQLVDLLISVETMLIVLIM